MANIDGTRYVLVGAEGNILDLRDTEADAIERADQIAAGYPVGYWVVVLSGPAKIRES